MPSDVQNLILYEAEVWKPNMASRNKPWESSNEHAAMHSRSGHVGRRVKLTTATTYSYITSIFRVLGSITLYYSIVRMAKECDMNYSQSKHLQLAEFIATGIK